MMSAGEVQHMALIVGTEYLPVDVVAKDSAEAVELLAKFLRKDAYIADYASDRVMVRSRVVMDSLTAARQLVSQLEKDWETVQETPSEQQ